MGLALEESAAARGTLELHSFGIGVLLFIDATLICVARCLRSFLDAVMVDFDFTVFGNGVLVETQTATHACDDDDVRMRCVFVENATSGKRSVVEGGMFST